MLLSRLATASLPPLKGNPKPYRRRVVVSQEDLAQAAGVRAETLREIISELEDMIAKDRAEGVTTTYE